jgi:hypothetical protein
MKTEYKYTTDGKKVIVVGNLNSQEKIVQEIFIVNGNEIPSGENFVAKSLHDAPAISWKEEQLKNLEARYDKDRKEWDSKIDKLNKEKRFVYDSLSERVKWLRNIAKEPREAEFKKVINQIADFLTDSEKWVLVRNYSEWDLFKFNEDETNSFLDRCDRSYGRLDFDSMRLLSLFGKADGSLVFRINEYSDGSGSDSRVLFFKSEKEALEFIQKDFDNIKEYNSYHLETAKKFNLKIDPSKAKTFIENSTKSFDKTIKEYEKNIANTIERKQELLKQLENHG